MLAVRSRLGPWLGLALAATLALLLAHAWRERFLTDDAFISFRYARNLAHGHGLVFNPGFERVEGYTNLLWVLILAGLDRLGFPPEASATPLSLLATIALWGVVSWFAIRLAPQGRGRAFALAAPLALAATRSVAVWSSGGLETRLFELLIVAATVRAIVELEAEAAGTPCRALSPWLFALGAWTRPEGLLFAGGSFVVGAVWLGIRGRLDPRRLARAWAPFAILVGAQVLFRRLYYGDWLPNTWYAKVGGETWWSSGIDYLASFALEYALWWWIPLALVGAVILARRSRGAVVAVLAAAMVPYALYVAAVGGDHFEYRLIDVVFPFLFVLAAAALCAMAASRRGAWVAGLLLATGLVGLWELPSQSRAQFPALPTVGFPGLMLDQRPEARAYLDPDKSPIYRSPPLRGLAERHRELLRGLTAHFVCIRQEEHARFAGAAVLDGHRLARLLERGVLPRDLYLALGAVGAVPYESDLRVLDMKGLTDRAVARSASRDRSGERMMAHERTLEWPDAVARKVDLMAVDASPLLALTSDAMLTHVREAFGAPDSIWAADVGDGFSLVARLPRGPEVTSRRIPRLRFEPLSSPGFVASFLSRAIAAWNDSLTARPNDRRARLRLAWLLLAREDYEAARRHYRVAVAAFPNDLEAWDGLAWCEVRRGDVDAARTALARAIDLARAQGETEHLHDLEARAAALTRPSR
jgi:arabinofuranosyltransferase